jgi:hypothetical protein
MIRKNIDVVAIAVLLGVMALYSEVHKVMLTDVIPNQGIVMARDLVERVFAQVPDPPAPSSTPECVFSLKKHILQKHSSPQIL